MTVASGDRIGSYLIEEEKDVTMTIVVTGATGHLGRLTVAALLERGVPATDIVAAGRNSNVLAEIATSGVRTAVIDFNAPDTLDAAFADADVVLLISSNDMARRVAQHTAVIDAAARAGVGRIVYTSAPQADTSPLILAPDHKATELLIAASGLTNTILRNGWYTENYLGSLEQAAATGELVAAAGDGRVASASRRDYAEAAAVVLSGPGHDGAVYELSGDVAWNYQDLAAAFAEVLGRPVTYRSVTTDELFAQLTAAGLDEGTAGFVAALDGNTADNLLAATSGDLARLIGRPTTPLVDGLRAAHAPAAV